MAETAEAGGTEDDAPPKKKSKALLFGLIGAVLLGGGAFYGVYSGLVPLPFGGEDAAHETAAKDGEGDENADEGVHAGMKIDDVAFVGMDDLIISLGPDATARHLKVAVSLEVSPDQQVAVQEMSPRILDVLNTFLRAVDETELENPRAMMRLRAQMLRRVRLVSPPGSIRDVLIEQFILN